MEIPSADLRHTSALRAMAFTRQPKLGHSADDLFGTAGFQRLTRPHTFCIVGSAVPSVRIDWCFPRQIGPRAWPRHLVLKRPRPLAPISRSARACVGHGLGQGDDGLQRCFPFGVVSEGSRSELRGHGLEDLSTGGRRRDRPTYALAEVVLGSRDVVLDDLDGDSAVGGCSSLFIGGQAAALRAPPAWSATWSGWKLRATSRALADGKRGSSPVEGAHVLHKRGLVRTKGQAPVGGSQARRRFRW